MIPPSERLGAQIHPDGATEFTVWAPKAAQMELHLIDQAIYLPMTRDQQGYYSCQVSDVKPGDQYLFRVGKQAEYPDPASRHQPEGVHGPSAVVSLDYAWQDAQWRAPSMRNLVFYQLHVGTYTAAGTFEAIIPYLPRLHDLGVNALQLLPVAQFPGERGWGYDIASPFAVQQSYGGPDGLRALVDAAHGQGLAVYLDAIYNHLGPEGNYLDVYGHYFSDTYRTPWGHALNFDGPHSDHVRRYVLENALYWLKHFHIDGLRLDATQMIFDATPRHILLELGEVAHDWAERHNRRVHIIAESDASDRRLLTPSSVGGYGLDGQWLDDLHHSLHVLLTGERERFYADYGGIMQMVKVLREGYAHTGTYSLFRQRRVGSPAADLPTDHFVVFSQNHDQVGNRPGGERLSRLTDFDGLKAAAALVTCSPYVPMLFMGEEYAETAPFYFFSDYSDEVVIAGMRAGRAELLTGFEGEPVDPQDEAAFTLSKLDHDLRNHGSNGLLYRLYRELLRIRRANLAITHPDRAHRQVHVDSASRVLALVYEMDAANFMLVINLHPSREGSIKLPVSYRTWRKILDSKAIAWQPNGTPEERAPDLLPTGESTRVTLPPKAFAIYE